MRFVVLLALMTISGLAYLRYVPLATRQRYESSPRTLEIMLAALSYYGICVVALIQWMVAPSDPIPNAVTVIGAVLFCSGRALVIWSMAVNPWFSKDVRWEQGQQFVTEGPYRFFPHPGYSGMMLSGVAMCSLLGQPWAFIPMGLYWLLLVRRVWVENRLLHVPQ